MATGDFTILEQGSSNGGRGSRTYVVGTASTAVINPGEPVTTTLGGATVVKMYGPTGVTGVGQPVVGTDYVVGIAQTTSNQTATVTGTVEVFPTNSGTTWLVTPNAPTSFDTQAEYDALVGDRVLIDLTSGAYTVLGTDSATSGLVIQPLNVATYPGKIAVAFRAGLSNLA